MPSWAFPFYKMKNVFNWNCLSIPGESSPTEPTDDR